jgi:hypothetical protein
VSINPPISRLMIVSTIAVPPLPVRSFFRFTVLDCATR